MFWVLMEKYKPEVWTLDENLGRPAYQAPTPLLLYFASSSLCWIQQIQGWRNSMCSSVADVKIGKAYSASENEFNL